MNPAMKRDGNAAFAAIVLAGGRGNRLGGVDKAQLEIGGRRLLDVVLAAVALARTVVVVGEQHETHHDVIWLRERPAGSGPAAAIAAGLERVDESLVVVMAVDLPNATAERVATLVRGSRGRDGAIFVDADQRDQPLFGCYRTRVLRRAVAGLRRVEGVAARDVIAALDLARIRDPAACADCDTWADLETLRAEARG